MLQASALAIIAGYADTVGYLHFGAFAGLMTGNTILLGIEIATTRGAEPFEVVEEGGWVHGGELVTCSRPRFDHRYGICQRESREPVATPWALRETR